MRLAILYDILPETGYRNDGNPLMVWAALKRRQEKGLLEVPRKGLENPTGGQRGPSEPQMTTDDVKHLRETNYKLYKEKLMKGLIKV